MNAVSPKIGHVNHPDEARTPGAVVMVGIDLGTTNSAIGHLGPTGRPELIEIDGARTCPSIVNYPTDGEVVVGAKALNRLAFEPDRTIRAAKRRMGSDDPYAIGEQRVSAVEVQAAVLRHLVDGAEASTGRRPTHAVITVPAYFDQAQRRDTRRAADLAGLSVERLLNEPTAAALARHPEGGSRVALVYDFGGGTFDVSVIRQTDEVLEVLASHGDTHLGGDDLDEALANLVLSRWSEERGVAGPGLVRQVRASSIAAARLAIAVEAAKRSLSTAVDAVVRLDYLVEDQGAVSHLEVALSRGDVEDTIAPHLERTLASVSKVLDDAGIVSGDLDEVLLVGGSTRIPAVWSLLHQALGIEPDRSLHPDESVALGAAVQAGLATSAEVGRILIDVSPYSLSVTHLSVGEVPHLRCRVITPRNTPIPSRYADEFWAMSPDQRVAEFYVFQGGSPDPVKNRCLGFLRLKGLRSTTDDSTARITVNFHYNLDGLVEVTVASPGVPLESALLNVDGLDTDELMRAYLDSCAEQEIAPGPGRRAGDMALSVSSPSARREGAFAPALGAWSLVDVGQESDEGCSSDAGAGAGGVRDDDFGGEGAGSAAAIEEDRQALRRIMGRFPELKKRHAAKADDLDRLVHAARDAFRAKPFDSALATSAYDELTDVLFDLGEFF